MQQKRCEMQNDYKKRKKTGRMIKNLQMPKKTKARYPKLRLKQILCKQKYFSLLWRGSAPAAEANIAVAPKDGLWHVILIF